MVLVGTVSKDIPSLRLQLEPHRCTAAAPLGFGSATLRLGSALKSTSKLITHKT
jgi:hypothetical protein